MKEEKAPTGQEKAERKEVKREEVEIGSTVKAFCRPFEVERDEGQEKANIAGEVKLLEADKLKPFNARQKRLKQSRRKKEKKEQARERQPGDFGEALGIDQPRPPAPASNQVEEPAELCLKNRIAQEIMNFVKKKHFSYKGDTPTEADGNCFIHSLLLQLQRPTMKSDDHQQLPTVGHEEFRHLVKNFILSSSESKVENMKKYFDELEGCQSESGTRGVEIGMPWDEYWEEIVTPGTWVDETFIQSSAWFLKKDIIILTINTENPLRYLKYQMIYVLK